MTEKIKNTNDTVLLTVESNGEIKSQRFPIGSNLLKSLYKMGFYEITNTCGGRGTCRRCVVNTENFGNVISCQTRLSEDTLVHLEKKAAFLEDDDAVKIQSNFSQPATTERKHAQITADTDLGLAIDVGTTTIVISLVNAETGDWLDEEKARNKQNGYGADVISRIDFSNKNGVEILSQVLQTQLNSMIDHLIKRKSIEREKIVVCSIAGNTIMEHFLASLSPQTIGVAPFNPLSYFGTLYSPVDLNLNLKPTTKIYMFPAIAGYVGGDITAGILSSSMYQSNKLNCLLDIGTNGEMVLGSADNMISCATAAGPAFEGAEIEKGMLGIPGAIDMVSYHPESEHPISYTTIEDESPKGFCGSGLLDMLAVGVNSGLIQETGLISDADEVQDNLKQYLAEVNQQRVIMLNSEAQIYLTQKDIRKLQSAKGAIAAGLKTLLEAAGVEHEDIATFYLAGGFGSAIRVRSLSDIGMIPQDFVNKTKVLGNSSLSGATMLIPSVRSKLNHSTNSVSQDQRSMDDMTYLSNIRNVCKYIELSRDENFTNNYIESMFFTAF